MFIKTFKFRILYNNDIMSRVTDVSKGQDRLIKTKALHTYNKYGVDDFENNFAKIMTNAYK